MITEKDFNDLLQEISRFVLENDCQILNALLVDKTHTNNFNIYLDLKELLDRWKSMTREFLEQQFNANQTISTEEHS